MSLPSAEEIIQAYNLQPHPEGGWYRQTWVAKAEDGERPSGTAILFLLKREERSHWHRVDATEIWLWHAGDPLRLSIHEGGETEEHTLSGTLAAGTTPQAIVPPHAWQSAEPFAGDAGYTLVSCTVSPGFRFEGFELAPPGWHPGRSEA
ncbi:MAG: cupin domain-containing protein [Pseudomonadota bacterium]